MRKMIKYDCVAGFYSFSFLAVNSEASWSVSIDILQICAMNYQIQRESMLLWPGNDAVLSFIPLSRASVKPHGWPCEWTAVTKMDARWIDVDIQGVLVIDHEYTISHHVHAAAHDKICCIVILVQFTRHSYPFSAFGVHAAHDKHRADERHRNPPQGNQELLNVHTLDIVSFCSEAPPQKCSGMAGVLEDFTFFTCIPTRYP